VYQEDQLIEKARAGDDQAFRYLVEKYQNYLFKVVFSVLRNEKDAEDATQEAFIKIYYALPKLEVGLKTWMTRIAMNHAIDIKRKKQRQMESVSEPVELTSISEGEENTVIPLLVKERRQVIQNRIHELPPNYRDVIFAYYITDKSYKEIAEEQCVEVKTIETKLYRARSWMRKHWKEDDF
jgi:RNA polymerase sigma factor (sigma-70 family)